MSVLKRKKEVHVKISEAVIFAGILFALLSEPAAAQKTRLPARSKWEAMCTDSSGQYYYPKLLKRFLDADTTLTDEELVLLEYGYTLQPSYAPYAQSMVEDSLYDDIKKQEYQKALQRGAGYLRTNPVSLRGNLAMAFLFKQLDNPAKREAYVTHAVQIVRAILSSGSGTSVDSAFIVINVQDEYTVLNILGYSVTMQSLVSDSTGRPYDMMKTVADNDTTEKRVFYFDVGSPMNELVRELQKKN